MKKFRMKAIYFVLSLLMVVVVYSLNTKVTKASENKTNSPTVLVPYQEVTESGTYIVPSPGRIEYDGLEYDDEIGNNYGMRYLDSNHDTRYYVIGKLAEKKAVRVSASEYEIKLKNGEKIKYIPESPSEYEQEDNDKLDSANPIIPNVLYKGDACCIDSGISSITDNDYFKIVLPEKGSLYAEIQCKALARKGLIYELYSENVNGNVNLLDQQISYETNVTTKKLRLSKGIYYVKIYPKERRVMFNYSLKMVYNEEAGEEFEIEKNDTKDTANKITVNKKYTGNLNEPVETEDRKIIDEDYYKFTLESTGKAQLQMVTPRQKAKDLFTAELLNENGKVLDTIKSEDNPAVYGQKKVLGAGDYYIRVYSSDNKYDSHVDYAIMCAFEGRVLADEVKITSKKVKFKVGDKYTLKAKILPENVSDKTIIWKSLDKKIATVDKNGVIKCKKAGEVIIRATSKESQTIYDEMHIIVEKNKEKISSSAKSVIPEKIYNKIKGWYAENSSGGYNVKVTRDYFIKYDRETGKVSSRWKIHKMKTKDNGYLFCVKYRDMESSYFCEKSKLGEGFDHLYSWDGDWIGYSGSSSLSKGKWGSWGN